MDVRRERAREGARGRAGATEFVRWAGAVVLWIAVQAGVGFFVPVVRRHLQDAVVVGVGVTLFMTALRFWPDKPDQ